MPLTIETPKTNTDFQRIAEIRSLAFGPNIDLKNYLFPRFTTPEGQIMVRDRLLKMQLEMESVRFAIVRDTDTGEIISQADWRYYDADSEGDSVPDLDLDVLEGNVEEMEYGRYLIESYFGKRRDAIVGTEVPLMLLDNLATDPKHQRRGAGSMLVKWGLDIADAIGGEAYVEASKEGKPVYEKFGFLTVENYTIPLPEKWAEKTKTEICLMRRPVTK